MRVMIAVVICVLIDDDRDPPKQAVAYRNPLDDLVQRMRREMQHGRNSATERTVDGAKVA